MTPAPRTANRRALELVAEHDLPWIDDLLRQVHALVGKPWRDAVAILLDTPSSARPRLRVAAIDAMRFLLIPPREALRGTHVRRALLGAPTLDPLARAARIDQTATSLRTSPEHLMQILWTDLAKQRVVELGRTLTAREIAAEANVRLIQRIIGRCFELRLLVRGDATAIVRAATVRGLLATLTTDHSLGAPPIVGADPVTELAISGPLTVFHRTTVYGRTLCALVRHLSTCRSFVLDARCDLGYGPTVFHIESPVILPPAPEERSVTSTERRFEKDLRKLAPAWTVERTPSAYILRQGAHRWWVEIIGYWTAEYLTAKLASHTGNVILCIDAARSLAPDALPAEARIVRYEGHVPVKDIVAILDRKLDEGPEPRGEVAEERGLRLDGHPA